MNASTGTRETEPEAQRPWPQYDLSAAEEQSRVFRGLRVGSLLGITLWMSGFFVARTIATLWEAAVVIPR